MAAVVATHPDVSHRAFEILDPKDFVENGVIFEHVFDEKMTGYDWYRFHNREVLIRGCDSIRIPVWIFLRLVVHLVPIAKSIYYGSEHDPVKIKA